MLELGAAKDEVSSLDSQAGKDKEAMEEDYQKALELIFTYDYGCYVFKHNICGDQPEVSDGMSDSFDPLLLDFFVNPKCPPTLVATKVMKTKVDQGKAIKEHEKSSFIGNRS